LSGCLPDTVAKVAGGGGTADSLLIVAPPYPAANYCIKFSSLKNIKEMNIMSFWDLPLLEQARIFREAIESSIALRIAAYLFLGLVGLASIILGIVAFDDSGGTFFIVCGLFLWLVVAIDIFINIRKNRFYW
jgi:hypothetical protein